LKGYTKDSYLFNIEHSRVSKDQLFLKFEVFNYQKKSVFKLKVQIDMTEKFKDLVIGKSASKVGFINLSSKNFFETFKDGVESAIGDGRIPFLPGI
jgi:hypothetical protein